MRALRVLRDGGRGRGGGEAKTENRRRRARLSEGSDRRTPRCQKQVPQTPNRTGSEEHAGSMQISCLCILLPRVSEACAITLLSSFFPPVNFLFCRKYVPCASKQFRIRLSFALSTTTTACCTTPRQTCCSACPGATREKCKARNKPASTPLPSQFSPFPSTTHNACCVHSRLTTLHTQSKAKGAKHKRAHHVRRGCERVFAAATLVRCEVLDKLSKENQQIPRRPSRDAHAKHV